MDIVEITGFKTGLDDSGVNFLDPAEAFEEIRNGLIYRQELKSRMGFVQFGNQLGNQKLAGDIPDGTRVMGIFENIDPALSGTKELLVISKKFLYSFNTGTQIFTQIKFNARILGIDPNYTFDITNNYDYVSGTTYLTKTGTKRFVFTGRGMKSVYFYEGTTVGEFTNGGLGGDNPDYQAPASGALTKATKIHWFGERLNLFVPVVGGLTYQQGVLYSGIRDGAGNGDKFNVPGSGLLSADTYELMKGTQILGDLLIMCFESSDWSLQKTRDAFNPYFVRKIPSVIGTDATFSPVSWNYEVKSIGRNGMLSTDGRQAVRFDGKIPFFTRDEIDQTDMELTYGGFDRFTNEFLFAYRENESDLATVTQDKVLCYNYEEETWSINDQRFSVFGSTNLGTDLTWNQIEGSVKASWARWDTTDDIWNRIGLGAEVQKTLAGDNNGYVYWLNVDFNDYATSVTNITNAAQAVIATEGTYEKDDTIYLSDVEGMTEINNIPLKVVANTGAAVTVDFDSTLSTPYTTGGLIYKPIDFEVKFAPFNPYRDKGMRCYVSHIEFLINTDLSGIYVDLYDDEEEAPFKENIPVIPDPLSVKKRQWITVSVDQETNFLNVRLKNENASSPIIISSIRIHCMPAGMTT